MNKNVYSVGQVNNYIKNMFAQDFMLHKISVKGEVSNCKYHSSGHIYFKMKDGKGAINAVMFAGNRRGLSFRMKDGDQVIVTGSVEAYERDGIYQIYARQIELDGEGNLYLRFEALKKELEEMGMFAQEYKQAIPKYVHTVGIVTAPTGAAIQDIRNIASRRNPYVQLILYPALVQGEGAAQSIVNGIHALEQLSVDVMIVGRGGGSIEDLWAFNEEIVARAIFDCPIPIISAVGHETDWTIADFVSDLRAPTPSAAAELAVFDYGQVVTQLQQLRMRMDRELGRRLEFYRHKAHTMQRQLYYLSPQNQLNTRRQELCGLQDRLQKWMEREVERRILFLAQSREKIAGRMDRILLEYRHRLQLQAGTLEGLSPMKKISGGFAYVQDAEGKALRHVKQLETGDDVSIQLMDGVVRAKVFEVEPKEPSVL